MIKAIYFSILFFAFCSFKANAQRNVQDSAIGTPLISLHYGGNWTGGDLKSRYGFINHVGVLAGYKTSKNWFWGIDANFMFGNKINMNDPLIGLRDSKGNITDENGDIASILYSVRGFNTNFSVGKIFPILSPNANSGIFVHAGGGILAHKLRIETNNQVVPPIEGNYTKGYDRYSLGFNTHQFVGYSFMANSGFFNFYGGFYAQQGFTTNQRLVNFDQPDIPVSKDTRLELQYGFKIGWMIPIYKRVPKDFYFD